MVKVSDTFNELRYTLSPPEIQRYRRLGQEAAEAVEAVCRDFEPGDSELHNAAALAYRCRKLNILPLVDLVAGDDKIGRYLDGANEATRRTER